MTSERLAELRRRAATRRASYANVPPETAEEAARQATELAPFRLLQSWPEDQEWDPYEARKARLRAVLAEDPLGERGPLAAEGFRDELEFLRPQRMRANAMLLGDDEDDDYTPMRWWNVIRQVRAWWAALGHIWVHNGPLWWLCSTCRSWRREDRL